MEFKELYYSLFRGVHKNRKFVYYLNGISNIITPKSYLHRKKKHFYKYYESLSDEKKEYVEDRVNYYCKLQTQQQLPHQVVRHIADHKYKNKVGNSVYFFDSYEFTRYFPGYKKFAIVPGDVTKVYHYPTIVKSRPISEDNENSVLLNMDKVRHFVFFNDPIAFKDKESMVIFRGACHGKPNRQKFIEMYHDNPLCDIKDSSTNSINPPEWQAKKEMSLYKHLNFKFIMALEGNDVASNLKWVMSSNSLAISPRLHYETWFMEGKLIPGYHYVEIASDFHDLEEKMDYYITHPEEAEVIIEHAHEYVAQFQNKKIERLISYLVMEKYINMVNK